MRWLTIMLAVGLTQGLATVIGAEPGGVVGLRAVPAEVLLTTPESSVQLLVAGRDVGRETTLSDIDLTRDVVYSIVDPAIVAITPAGRLSPLRDGRTEVVVTYDDQTLSVPVEVRGMRDPLPVSFRRDVVPILSKGGCNAGGCHGKAEGQNGFKLSVFGFDPRFDHQAIVMEGRGRRVTTTVPGQSLLLRKGTASVPHGGGRKIEPQSRWARQIERWIAEGATFDNEIDEAVVELRVTPSEVTLPAHAKQQLRVTVRAADGHERCVTAEAEFQSNQETIASVSTDGLIEVDDAPGEAAILVRYLGHVAVCRVTRPREQGAFHRPPEVNFIDRLVWDKLQRLRIEASPLADDAAFLRRVSLDTIGTLPTADEAKSFLEETAADKRSRVIADLLRRPEYADYWTQKWSDILQVDKDTINPQGAVAMTRWVHGQIERNVPYDEFVRSILTAQGSVYGESPAAFFQVQGDPEKLARSVSQLFLGVRIECAQCHHHPFEKWDQRDYFALAGFFTGIERRKDSRGIVKIVSTGGKDLPHPRTKETIAAAGLGTEAPTFAPGEDRRRELARWLTSRENPYFARTIANRLWAHYFGRGLVEPVDDLRTTNPASNEPLLQALAEHLIEVDYDIQRFTQTLLNSRVYQLSAESNASNQLDEQSFSHASWKSIPAEVLLDAISQATAVPEEFNGWPIGYRAIQIWDNKLPSHFMEVFGRPTRQTVCSCERGTEPSIAQALHLMNSTDTTAKVQSRRGRAFQLAASDLTADEIIEELYLTTLTRWPTSSERTLMRAAFSEATDRREATEDILWTLLNTKEFVFNH
ncbi:MAG: DUF1549 domain-containing protein [Planctomycetaceae bacterium]